MGGRGSGGGRSGGGGNSSKNTQPQSRGERIYKEKALKEAYINRKEFNEMREYLRENGSKEDILKLADRYGEVYNNRLDRSGMGAAEFRSYELSLRNLAAEKQKQQRIENLKKAREKRAENLKNGIKPEKKQKPKTKPKGIPSDDKISEMVKKIAPNSKGWTWESNHKEITVFFFESRKVKNSTWNKLIKKLGEVGISDVMIASTL